MKFGFFLLTLAISSSIEANNWYAEGRGGVNVLNDANEKRATLEFDNGSYFATAVGHSFSENAWVEAEFAYRKNRVRAISVPIEKVLLEFEMVGLVTQMGVMGNIVCDLFRKGLLLPYVGGGVGSRWEKRTWGKTVQCTVERLETAFQGIGGVKLNVLSNTKGKVEYHYLEGVMYSSKNHTVALVLEHIF